MSIFVINLALATAPGLYLLDNFSLINKTDLCLYTVNISMTQKLCLPHFE